MIDNERPRLLSLCTTPLMHQPLVDGVLKHTLYIANGNGNDFLPSSGDNNFYVFGITDAKLRAVNASYTAQAIARVPEPMSVAPVCLGLMGVGMARRRK